MRKPPALAALVASALLLASCGTSPDDAETAQNETDTSNPAATTAQPDPDDDYQPLPINLVAQSGTYFPDGVEGITFGCSDTLVSITTVPKYVEDTEDIVSGAIQFLLDDSQYYHGDPSVTNSLTLSETLELSAVEVGRNSVDIKLTGDVVVRGECEAYRIQAQMYGTAASSAGVDDVSITVDGTELNDVLGLQPFDTSQLATADAG